MAVQAVGRPALEGYMHSLVECVTDLWKRVYEYACALFAYLFGSGAKEPVREAVHLPPPVTTLIADYLLMPNQYEDFLYVTRKKLPSIRYEYDIKLEMELLRKAFVSIKGLADCFSAPHLLGKIEELCCSYYYIPREEIGPSISSHADITWLFRIDDPEWVRKNQGEIAKCLKITLEELPQVISDWRMIMNTPAVADALARVKRGEKFPSIYVPLTKAKADSLVDNNAWPR